MTGLLAIVVVGVGTFISRAVFIVALAGRDLPQLFVESLRFVAPAVLAALVVTLLTGEGGEVDIGAAEVGGLLTGGVVAYASRNHVATLVGGMAAFWLLRVVLS